MNACLRRASLLCFMSLLVTSISLASDPQIQGQVAGVEICTQQFCGAAIFVGSFQGTVDGRPAFGYWTAGVNHETPLPDLFETKKITGGSWQMKVWVFYGFFPRKRVFAGNVEYGGSLTQSSPDLFTVDADLNIVRGGPGSMSMDILLDHTRLPFTVNGLVSPGNP